MIQDLLAGPIDCVTEITSKAGAVRGNHYHPRTQQWAYVVAGTLLTAWVEDDGVHQKEHGPGSLITEPAGAPHAWRSVTDTTVLVFTRGPRAGEAYDSDTYRLEVPILT